MPHFNNIFIGFLVFVSLSFCSDRIGPKEHIDKEGLNIPVYDFEGFTEYYDLDTDTVYIINFWATWCAPCLKELPELERFYQQNKDTAHLWGVTFEDSDKASIVEFVERLGITFPILGYGEDPLTGYGEVRVLPTTFLINPEGKIAKIYTEIKDKDAHAQEVLEEIKF